MGLLPIREGTSAVKEDDANHMDTEKRSLGDVKKEATSRKDTQRSALYNNA